MDGRWSGCSGNDHIFPKRWGHHWGAAGLLILGWKLSDELMLASKMTWKDKQSSVRPFPALGIKCGIVRHRTILLLQDGVNVRLHHMMMDLVSHSFGNLNLQNGAIGFQPAVGLAESLIRGEKPQVSPGDSTHLEARLPLLHTLICCLHKLLLDVLVRRWLQVSKSVFTENSRHLPCQRWAGAETNAAPDWMQISVNPVCF